MFHEEPWVFHAGAGVFQLADEPLFQAGGAWLYDGGFIPLLGGAKADVVGLGVPDVITGPL